MQDLDPVVEKSKIWHKGSVPIRSKTDFKQQIREIWAENQDNL